MPQETEYRTRRLCERQRGQESEADHGRSAELLEMDDVRFHAVRG